MDVLTIKEKEITKLDNGMWLEFDVKTILDKQPVDFKKYVYHKLYITLYKTEIIKVDIFVKDYGNISTALKKIQDTKYEVARFGFKSVKYMFQLSLGHEIFDSFMVATKSN